MEVFPFSDQNIDDFQKNLENSEIFCYSKSVVLAYGSPDITRNGILMIFGALESSLVEVSSVFFSSC